MRIGMGTFFFICYGGYVKCYALPTYLLNVILVDRRARWKDRGVVILGLNRRRSIIEIYSARGKGLLEAKPDVHPPASRLAGGWVKLFSK